MPKVALGAFIISFSAVFIKTAGLAPEVAAFYRMFFGSLTMLFLLTRAGKLGSLPSLLISGLPAALLLTGDFFCWHRAIFAIGPGLSTMLGNLQAVVIPVFSVLFLSERAGMRFFSALLLALTGVSLTVGPDWGQSGEIFRTGVYFGVATALFYAAYILCLKRLSGKTNPLAAVTAICIDTAILCGIIALASGQSFALPNATAWSSMLALGVVCQGIGWLLITKGLDTTRASLAGLVLLMQPALSFVWDILFFAKPVNPVEIFGVCLTLAGIYLGSLKTSTPVKKPKTA